jgi:ribosomal protein S18 acetylase RimI-like enzyme
MHTGRERAIAHRHAHHTAICDRIVPWEHGTVVLATDLPTYYDYNVVRLESPDPGISTEALVAVADRLLDGLGHRQVEVEDEAAGRRLRPGFERLGWDAERLVWMELEGRAAASLALVEISEEPLERTRPMREAWFTASGWMPTLETAREFMVVEEDVAERTGVRALVAWGPGGEPVGFVTFSVLAGTAEIEQAWVEPGRRDGGIGGALVAAAIEAAGTPTTLIVADDEEPAKRLYARLGFAPVWIQHQFTLRRPPPDPQIIRDG